MAGTGTGSASPWGYAAQGLGDLAGAAFGAQAQRRAADQLSTGVANQLRIRQAIQAGIAPQFQPYQQLGYGSLMPLAQLAGATAGSFQAPQGRSFLASSPAYPMRGSGMPLAALGGGQPTAGGAPQPGGGAPDWTALLAATQHAQHDLPTLALGEQPGNPTAGARNQLTGGRNGDLVLRTPQETAYANQWLQANPGQAFGDADLHGYRNLQAAQAAGLTAAQFQGLSAQDQKNFLKGGLAQQVILARTVGKAKR